MSQAFFVAGTDTGVGKTLVCAALLHALGKAGLSTAAIKPVAAGGELTAEGVRNEDALILRQAATLSLSYEELNPVMLAEPLAPHIAAAREGLTLSAAAIAEACRPVLDYRADVTVIEGAGGWRVPLSGFSCAPQIDVQVEARFDPQNSTDSIVDPIVKDVANKGAVAKPETMADIARHLQLPVILVVGMRLGCLNHALLSAEAIAADGLVLAGWVANGIEPDMAAYQENLDTLKRCLPAPLIAEIPWLATADATVAAGQIKLNYIVSV